MYIEFILPALTVIPFIIMCCLLYIGDDEDILDRETPKDKK